MKYRKKPVIIDAFQMTKERRADNRDWPKWLHTAWQKEREEEGSLHPLEEGTSHGLLEITTLEGMHLVNWYDWIIQGIKKEIYPCKPDIFEATYEPIDFHQMPLKEFHKYVLQHVDDDEAFEIFADRMRKDAEWTDGSPIESIEDLENNPQFSRRG